jgi:hypothetical protein
MWQAWVNGVLGLWLIVAPWVLGFNKTNSALWDNVILGIVVAALGFWGAALTNKEKTSA